MARIAKVIYEEATPELQELFIRGLYTRVLDNIICLAPPLIATEEQIDNIAEIVVDAVNNLSI